MLLSLKVWEIRRGGKPFSVLRYRMDILVHKSGEQFRYWWSFVNTRTFRLILAFLVAKTGQIVSMGVGKLKESKLFRLVKGKILPPGGAGPVSAFLRDVAEFKKEAAGEAKKQEENKNNSENENK